MRILFIIHSLGIGGMEHVMVTLLRYYALNKTGELHLLIIGRNREILHDVPEQVDIHKPTWEFNNNVRFWHTLKTISFVRKKTKDINPDTILSFGEMWNNLVLLALLGLPYPIFISDRSQPGKDLGWLQNCLREQLYPMARGYIAQTEEAKKVALKKKWNYNIEVIGNPILQISCTNASREKNVISVGRLIPTKQFDKLISVFHQCKPKDWRLIIVGGDAKKMQLSKKLNEIVHHLRIEEQVILTGAQRDVVPYYCDNSVFAFMSISEGFPNALAEAMAAGCACIAYDCIAGPSDIIDDGINGFLIPLGDHEMYKKKLSQLMSDEGLRFSFGRAAKEKMKQFEIGKIAERFHSFITESF